MRFGSCVVPSLLCFLLAVSACVPVPLSTVALHPRQQLAAAAESAPAEGSGLFSALAFDASGALLAVYDSGADRVQLLRGSDLTKTDSRQPRHWPRRLSFSPQGQFLVLEAHQGWVEDFLQHGSLPSGADINSPAAMRDDVQRAEVWNLRTGQTTQDLACDAVSTSEPQGGWLWARDKAITPGYRSSAILTVYFSRDEREFLMLCWNGVRQRWDTSSWTRLADIAPPPFWTEKAALTNAHWFAGEDAATLSDDGRTIVLRVREKALGFSTTYLWDLETSRVHPLPGDCATRLQPSHAISRDGRRIVAVCNSGLGHAIRVWDLAAGRELPLRDAEFGITRGAPVIRGAGVALSPDGRHVAVVLLDLVEGMLVGPVPVGFEISRSDLRLWNVDSGRELVALSLDDVDDGANHFTGVDLAMSPDSEMLAVGGRRVRVYRVVDLSVESR
jgi:hypothetical protein